ncbi:MAG: (d)CMP kinase, partial [Alphaproteobacteria bacterium]
MIIAIDGPASSGKGTLARRLAAALDFAHLDTGALYRAVALAMLRAGADPADADTAADYASRLDLSLLDDPRLRDEITGIAASQVAAHGPVRERLLALQRGFAAHPPGGKGGAVLDGRDVGTVICPDADLKIFLIADARVRAARRVKELEDRGLKADFDAILADIEARDAQDRARAHAPLKPAADAHLLDNSNLDIEATLQT